MRAFRGENMDRSGEGSGHRRHENREAPDYRWSSYASYLKGKGVKKKRLFKFPIQTVPPLCNSDEAVGATDFRLTGDQKGQENE